jgi:hypothetical protein
MEFFIIGFQVLTELPVKYTPFSSMEVHWHSGGTVPPPPSGSKSKQASPASHQAWCLVLTGCSDFWEVLGLKQGPLCLVSTTEEPLGRKSSGSGIEIREYGHGDPLRWLHDTPYPQKLALTSPTCGGHLVGIVCSQTKTMEFSLVYLQCVCLLMALSKAYFISVALCYV